MYFPELWSISGVLVFMTNEKYAMETVKNKTITVETTIKAPVKKVWSYWTDPKHITQWCFASDDWHAPNAENDLWVSGRFRTRMAAKNGSSGFDFEGVYTRIVKHEKIEYTIPDGRTVSITFSESGGETRVVESFDAENENPYELQKGGWQAILNNFKKYAENQ
jgi:uncharacterized protein YndB with AHSA1/START domain